MVFSTDNLYRQENIIDNAPINIGVTKVSENTSLFINALHYIIEENILVENELAKYNIATYSRRSSILEDKEFTINIKTGLGEKISNATSGLYNKVKTALTIENIVNFIITG